MYRPKLQRVAAVGLSKRAPTPGLTFKKGVGLIGLCVEANDSETIFTLDTAVEPYRSAVAASDSTIWDQLNAVERRGLEYAEAKKLAQRYGEVIAKVVQDLETGEPIGCVTISIGPNTTQKLSVISRSHFSEALRTLAQTMSEELA